MSNKRWNRSSAITPEDLAFTTALTTLCVQTVLRKIRATMSPDEMQRNRKRIAETLNQLTKTIREGVDKILKDAQ